MNAVERKLVEEYKKLDLQMEDLLGTKNGVTSYIRAMEAEKIAASSIPGWKEDLGMLKHLRHVRNMIMHEDGDSRCRKADADEVEKFMKRLRDRDDPLARLKKKRKKKGRRKIGKKDKGAPGKIWPLILILIAVILLLALKNR